MLLVLLAAAAVGAFLVWHLRSLRSRTERIKQFVFPASIEKKVKSVYPHLTDAQTATVMRALRDYFQISLLAKRRMVSMPSKVVDVAWHEFILFTRLYQQFCREAFGRFLHHTPAEAMRTPTQAQEGIKCAWKLACKREGINPMSPDRLPLLFAIDAMLAIPDGYRYSLNCQSGSDYCASHIGCSSCGSSSSGDGGGCSGGGDGGGCGGGD
jgi:hypothetical protein